MTDYADLDGDQVTQELAEARRERDVAEAAWVRARRDRDRYYTAWQSARQGRAKTRVDTEARVAAARREERERCARMAEDSITYLPARIRALPDAEDAMCGATWTHQDHTHMCAREAPAGSEYVCRQDYTHTCAQPPGHQGAHIAAGDTARWFDLDSLHDV